MTGDWAVPTTSRDDIRKSLQYAADKILENSGSGINDDFRIIISGSVYAWMASWHTRWKWKEMYRAARILGNRQIAFDTIGNRRRLFQLSEGYERDG